MSYSAMILPEFDHEMASTRKVLALVPDDKFEWKAHPTLHTVGWNANHLAEIPKWAELTFTMDALDVAPANGPRYQSPKLTTHAEVVNLFDANVAAARTALAAVKDEQIGQSWSLLQTGQPIFTMPRAAVIRSFVLNHSIHHRGHLCAYLRMLDVAVPGMYGPG